MSLGRLRKTLRCTPFGDSCAGVVDGGDDKATTTLTEDTGGGSSSSGGGDGAIDTQQAQQLYIPASIQTLLEIIEHQRLDDRVQVGRLLLCFTFTIGENLDDVGGGALRQLQKTEVMALNDSVSPELLFADNEEALKPRLLAAHIVAHDCTAMPVDTVFVLKGVEQTGGAMLPRGGHCALEQGSVAPQALYENEIVFEDKEADVRVSSIEAIDFNSVDFSMRVARRVDGSDMHQVARLFAVSQRQRAARWRATACTRHGVTHQCYLLVPYAYHYRSLIMRVHMLLCVRKQRAAGEQVSVHEHRLPRTSDYMVIECEALTQALEFIDVQLVNAHPIFDARRVNAALHPFAPRDYYPTSTARLNTAVFGSVQTTPRGKWMSIWSDRNALYTGLIAQGRTDLDTSTPLECRVTCLVYYMFLAPERFGAVGHEPPRPRRRVPAAVSVPERMKAATSLPNASTTTDEEGGNDISDSDLATTNSQTLSDKTAQTAASETATRRGVFTPHGFTPDVSSADLDHRAPSATHQNGLLPAKSVYNFSFAKYLTEEQQAQLRDADFVPALVERQVPAVTPRERHQQQQNNQRPASSDLASATTRPRSVTTGSQDDTNSEDGDDDSESVFSPAPPPPAPSSAMTPPSIMPLSAVPIHLHSRAPPPLPRSHAPLPPPGQRNLPPPHLNAHTGGSVATDSSGEQLVFHLSSSSTNDGERHE